MSDSRCQSCGEPLLWVVNVATGKRLPLVAVPNRAKLDQLKPGMVVVSPDGKQGKILTLDVIGRGGERLQAAVAEQRVYTTHFADCPQSQQWQGARR